MFIVWIWAVLVVYWDGLAGRIITIIVGSTPIIIPHPASTSPTITSTTTIHITTTSPPTIRISWPTAIIMLPSTHPQVFLPLQIALTSIPSLPFCHHSRYHHTHHHSRHTHPTITIRADGEV